MHIKCTHKRYHLNTSKIFNLQNKCLTLPGFHVTSAVTMQICRKVSRSCFVSGSKEEDSGLYDVIVNTAGFYDNQSP
jgi:hypothetical protein